MKYEKSVDGDESEYDSDSGYKYRPEKVLGTGSYATARLFKATEDKTVVIMSPIHYEKEEIEAKHVFFKTNYPNDRVELFRFSDEDENYRLLVPYIQGQSYKLFYKYRTIPVDPSLLTKIFLSALEAVEQCHNKGLMVIDIKADNVLYNPKTGKTQLIDGGLSTKIGDHIRPSIFKNKIESRAIYIQQVRDRLAPECLTPGEITISTSMDVFAVGHLMKQTLPSMDEKLTTVYHACLNEDPRQRPDLQQIKLMLEKKIFQSKHQNEYVFLCYVIQALQQLHTNGIVMVRLSSENIGKDENGDLVLHMIAPYVNLKINNKYRFEFKDPIEEALEYHRTKYYQYAPESWSTSGAPATCAMDVYSLGVMFRGIFSAKGTDKAMIQLFNACADPKPINRPDISSLKNTLSLMQKDIELEKGELSLKL